MRCASRLVFASAAAVVAAGNLIVPRPALAAEVLLEARFQSEFRRPGPDGEIVAGDAAGSPREIISPALVRNGFTSFFLVVKGPAGQPYRLFIALNPEGLLRTSLGRFDPATGLIEPLKNLEADGKFNAHGAALYWVDIWTPSPTPLRRIRLEAQLNRDQAWVITPLELRVMAASVPEQPPPRAPRSAMQQPAAALYRAHYCKPGGGGVTTAAPALPNSSLTAKLQRNAAQDLLIAAKLEFAQTRPVIEALVARALGAASIAAWCAAPPPADPETFLRVRDALWRADR